ASVYRRLPLVSMSADTARPLFASPSSFYLRFPFFFFTDSAPTEIYTLSLHDALPISSRRLSESVVSSLMRCSLALSRGSMSFMRSEEHTSELQSRVDLVCRLLLEKKKRKQTKHTQSM